MNKIDSFLNNYVRVDNCCFVSRKTLFRYFKAKTNSKIKARDFKKYCDSKLKTKSNFNAIDTRLSKKKHVREAYQIQIKVNDKWQSDFKIKVGNKLLKVVGFVADLKIYQLKKETRVKIVLVSKYGESLGVFGCSYDKANKFLKRFFVGSKIEINYYKNNGYSNIFSISPAEIVIASDLERLISGRIRQYYRDKIGLNSLFGEYVDQPNVSFDDELVA